MTISISTHQTLFVTLHFSLQHRLACLIYIHPFIQRHLPTSTALRVHFFYSSTYHKLSQYSTSSYQVIPSHLTQHFPLHLAINRRNVTPPPIIIYPAFLVIVSSNNDIQFSIQTDIYLLSIHPSSCVHTPFPMRSYVPPPALIRFARSLASPPPPARLPPCLPFQHEAVSKCSHEIILYLYVTLRYA